MKNRIRRRRKASQKEKKEGWED